MEDVNTQWFYVKHMKIILCFSSIYSEGTNAKLVFILGIY